MGIYLKKLRIPFAIILLSLIVFITFLPTLNNRFTNWDDPDYVTRNPRVKSLSCANIKNIFSSFQFMAYQPLVILSFAIEHHFFKLNPRPYHTTNLLLHIGNSLLVFWLIFALSGSFPASFITAVLFAIHPLQVETVAWISERKGLLASLFFLGAAISYVYYVAKARSRSYYWLALCLFGLSLLSKATTAIFPVLLFCVDYLIGRRKDKTILSDKIPFFAFSLIFGIVAIFAISTSHAVAETAAVSFPYRIAMPFVTIGFYLHKLLLPVRLCALYAHPGRGDDFLSLKFLIYLVPITALFIIAVVSRRYTKKVIFSAAFFLVMLFPYIQLVPVGWTLVSDRYVYLPSIGIFFMVSTVWMWLYRHKTKQAGLSKASLVVVLGLIIGMCSFLSYRRILVWRDGESLWSDAVDNFRSAYAYFNRGYFYYTECRFDEAILDLNKAIQIDPQLYTAYHNRGVVYLKRRDYDRAIGDLSIAIKHNVKPAFTYFNRGLAYSRLNKIDEAISDFSKSIELSAENKRAYYLRAKAYFQKQQYTQCWDDLQKAKALGLDIEPEFIERVRQGSGSVE